jgi:hypothetical protein
MRSRFVSPRRSDWMGTHRKRLARQGIGKTVVADFQNCGCCRNFDDLMQPKLLSHHQVL